MNEFSRSSSVLGFSFGFGNHNNARRFRVSILLLHALKVLRNFANCAAFVCLCLTGGV